MSNCCDGSKLQFNVSGVSNACPVEGDGKHVVSGEVVDSDIVLTLTDESEVSIDVSELLEDIYVSDFSLSGSTIVLTRNDGTSWSGDLSPLLTPDVISHTLSMSGNELTSTIVKSDGTVLEDSVIIEQDCALNAENGECYNQDDRTVQVGAGGCPVIVPSLKGNLTSAGSTDVHIACDGTITVGEVGSAQDTHLSDAILSEDVLVLTMNNGSVFNIDLSQYINTDTYINGVTLSGDVMSITRSDGASFDISLSQYINKGYAVSKQDILAFNNDNNLTEVSAGSYIYVRQYANSQVIIEPIISIALTGVRRVPDDNNLPTLVSADCRLYIDGATIDGSGEKIGGTVSLQTFRPVLQSGVVEDTEKVTQTIHGYYENTGSGNINMEISMDVISTAGVTGGFTHRIVNNSFFKITEIEL